MDTDDLTPMAYETLSLAHDASDYLRAEIGAAAMRYSTEEKFLIGIRGFLQDIQRSPKEYLDSHDLRDSLSTKAFVRQVDRIQVHITKTLEVPLSERGKPPFRK